MAIALDSSASAQSATNVSAMTYSHTTGAGLQNSKLVVGVTYYNLAVSASGITYNGVALTKVLRLNDASHNAATELWYLDSPAAGSHSVVVTMTGSASRLFAGSYSLSGVKSGAVDASAVGSVVIGTHSTHADNITTISAGDWVIDVLCVNAGTAAATASGSQTNVLSQTTTDATGALSMSTLGPKSPAGLQAMGWTFTSSANATAHSALALAPAPSAGLFLPAGLEGLGAGGPFFSNPIT